MRGALPSCLNWEPLQMLQHCSLLLLLLFLFLGGARDAAGNQVQIPLPVGGNQAALAAGVG